MFFISYTKTGQQHWASKLAKRKITRANVKKTPRFGGHSIPTHANTAKDTLKVA